VCSARDTPPNHTDSLDFLDMGEDGTSMTALPKRHEKLEKERGAKIRV
jgi:hypothetical protein